MFEQVKRELAPVAAADVSACPVEQLAEEMRELHALELFVVAQRLRRLEVFDRREGCVEDGQVTAAAWSRSELGLSHGAATAELSVARVRRCCPVLTGVFEAGRTSFRHLQVVAAAMRRLGQPEVWELLDEQLAGWAQETDVRRFAEMVDALVEQLRPEPKPKDEKQRDGRRLSVTSGFDGMVNVSGRFTPEVGEKLHAALSAASRPDVEGETRTAGQRKADAMEHVLDTVLDTKALPIEGGEKPHIVLHVPVDSLDQPEQTEPVRLGDLWTETAAVREQRAAAAVAVAETLDSRPRFSFTGPTGPDDARRMSCDGIVLPIFTRGGEPLDAGQRRRIVDSALRAFIVTRDRHCQWKNCQLEPRWCQVHHVQHWKDGGPTDRWNLVLLCQEHHRAAHGGQFVVVLYAPGKITIRPRRQGDPYYEIRNPQPPPGQQQTLEDLLTEEARHMRKAG